MEAVTWKKIFWFEIPVKCNDMEKNVYFPVLHYFYFLQVREKKNKSKSRMGKKWLWLLICCSKEKNKYLCFQIYRNKFCLQLYQELLKDRPSFCLALHTNGTETVGVQEAEICVLIQLIRISRKQERNR